MVNSHPLIEITDYTSPPADEPGLVSVEAEVLLAAVVDEAAVLAHGLTWPQAEETEARGRPLPWSLDRITNCLAHLVL